MTSCIKPSFKGIGHALFTQYSFFPNDVLKILVLETETSLDTIYREKQEESNDGNALNHLLFERLKRSNGKMLEFMRIFSFADKGLSQSLLVELMQHYNQTSNANITFQSWLTFSQTNLLVDSNVFFNIIQVQNPSSSSIIYILEDGMRNYLQSISSSFHNHSFLEFMNEVAKRILYSITSIKDFDPYILSMNINADLWA
jgi:hypothetical protein